MNIRSVWKDTVACCFTYGGNCCINNDEISCPHGNGCDDLASPCLWQVYKTESNRVLEEYGLLLIF